MNETATLPELDRHIRREAIVNFFVNIAINGGIVYWTMSDRGSLALLGAEGFAIDLLFTGLLLSAIITGIFMWMGRRQGRSGKFPLLDVSQAGVAARLPVNPWAAALLFGLFGVGVAVLTLVLLLVLGVSELSPVQYAWAKGIWAGVLAAALVPVAFRHGLRKPEVENGESGHA